MRATLLTIEEAWNKAKYFHLKTKTMDDELKGVPRNTETSLSCVINNYALARLSISKLE